MFSHQFYNVLHILGLALAMAGLAGTAAAAASGVPRQSYPARGLLAALHGGGLLLVLVGGFGMLARIGFRHGASLPGWVLAKLVLWVLLGGLIALPWRRPALAKPLLAIVPLVAALAAWLGIAKPF